MFIDNKFADVCPFCFGDHLINTFDDEYGFQRYIECQDCYAHGPHERSFEGAIDAWNKAKRQLR